MVKRVGVEWINAYDNLPELSHEHEDADGFYNELVFHDGWQGRFNWGNVNAWEEDFKRTDKGGTAPDWADCVDIAYFTGHGSPWCFFFRTDSFDDQWAESDHVTGANNGDLRLGSGRLEWLALEVCEALRFNEVLGGVNRNVFDRWRSVFEGLHAILSFTTTSLDLKTPGKYFASLCDGRWLTTIFGFGESSASKWPIRVLDSWFAMTSLTQDDDVQSAVLYVNDSDSDTQNDYIHGHGHLSEDPQNHIRTWVPRWC